MLVFFLACTTDTTPSPEPLNLPEDPAEQGVPVGVRTYQDAQITLEIWYPASDSVADQEGESVDFDGFLPASVTDRLGPVDFPSIPTIAVRDAPLRVPETPYPVVLFSHGFGGTRLQSVDYTTHLASRGYVVIAPDLGPELLTGSTRLKAGTATKLILNMFSTLAMVKLGKVRSNLMIDVAASNTKLRARAARILSQLSGLDEAAARRKLARNNWSIRAALGRRT